jgi:LPS sulfotransferase NodH
LTQYNFEKPVIIVAAPRSGSTLLFEQLSKSEEFWTIGSESHQVIEGIAEFNVTAGQCDSNTLTGNDIKRDSIQVLRDEFHKNLKNSKGVMWGKEKRNFKPRFLEKTPKNTLRIGMLNEVFPDALFIYLYRDPRENISSIIEAWRSKRFQTYRNLPGRVKPWSLLLPKGWQTFHDATLEEHAAFQWNAANQSVIEELSKLDRQRWTSVSYHQLVSNPEKTLHKLCDFAGVSKTGLSANNKMAMSRYTLTEPSKNKWLKNAALIKNILHKVVPTIESMRQFIPDVDNASIDTTIDETALCEYVNLNDISSSDLKAPPNRNSQCSCGSKLRYKHCHGKNNN